MNLNKEPFNMIKNGEKTIELRLNDEKRQQLKIGDYIKFYNIKDNDEFIFTEITNLFKFDSFKELYKALDLKKCGYKQDELPNAKHEDMLVYYSIQNQLKYGVLGIEIKVLQSNSIKEQIPGGLVVFQGMFSFALGGVMGSFGKPFSQTGKTSDMLNGTTKKVFELMFGEPIGLLIDLIRKNI